MEKAFKELLKTRFPEVCEGKLLLAVSGGVDSMVLVHLCRQARLNIALAHCNFRLRGRESDQDEAFVKEQARKMGVEVYSQRFDTEKYAIEHRLSVQMAARELRYEWFDQLRANLKMDFILAAHHANDDLETFMINLVRGTGLEGLAGIRPVNNFLIRPLLGFSREEILSFAHQREIPWREDSSNASTKYIRNKIRHELVPVLKELNPQYLETFMQTQIHLREGLDLIEDYISLIYPKVVEKTRLGYELDVLYLKKLPNTRALLYHLLKSFGFRQWDDLYQLLEAQPGKMVLSDTHRLIKDREKLILTETPEQVSNQEFLIKEAEEFAMLPMGTFHFSPVSSLEDKAINCIFVDPEKLEYPLVVRKWREGDYFYPFGMKGRKKLSDFFRDNKLSLPEKENTWLLCSGKKIIWVVNQRADNRFAIYSPKQHILKITYTP